MGRPGCVGPAGGAAVKDIPVWFQTAPRQHEGDRLSLEPLSISTSVLKSGPETVAKTDRDSETFELMMEKVFNRKQSMRRHQQWEQDTTVGG